MSSLSLQDTDPYYRKSSRDPYSTRTARDRSIDSSPRAYYDSRRIPRAADEGAVEARPVSAKKHNAVGQKATSRNAYVIRPRSRTSSESGRRPQIFVSSSSSRQSSLASEYGRPRAPQGHFYANDDTSRLVIPGSSRHQRVYPIDSKGITKGYVAAGGETRDKPTTRDPVDIDMYDSYSYTNPREQFYRDSDLIEDYRRESAKQGERTSTSGFPSPQSRREWRKSGPPPSTRGFERIPVDENRRSLASSGYDSSGETERRRSQVHPVALYQSGHDKYKDTLHGPRNYRIRHAEDGTVIVEDRTYYSSQRPPQYAYNPMDDRREPVGVTPSPYPPNDYTRSSRGGYDHEPLPERVLREKASYDRTRDKPKPAYSDSEDDSSEDDNRVDRYRKSDRPRKYSDERSADDRKGDRPLDTKDKKAAVSSAAELIEDPQKKKPQAVEPKTPPKGILKTPTEKFPEDPNAVREGVAPLKDATKKGIPPNARWTKINRSLVSPSVLEGQERYEERPDYVIVHRVLSKEEIHDYALKTIEVRSK